MESRKPLDQTERDRLLRDSVTPNLRARAQVEALFAVEAGVSRAANALTALCHVVGGESPRAVQRSGLIPGDLRLLEDVSAVDDRGLELAETFLHEHRQSHDPDDRLDRALSALSRVRDLTKRSR